VLLAAIIAFLLAAVTGLIAGTCRQLAIQNQRLLLRLEGLAAAIAARPVAVAPPLASPPPGWPAVPPVAAVPEPAPPSAAPASRAAG